MNHPSAFKRSHRFYSPITGTVTVVLFISALLTWWATAQQTPDVTKQQIQLHKHYVKLQSQLNLHIQQTKQRNLELANQIATDPQITQWLRDEAFPPQALQKLSSDSARQMVEDNIWLHVVDPSGKSLYRSWTNQHGDNVLPFRPEIYSLLTRPQSNAYISVGKFNASIKADIPLINQQHHLDAVIEVISPFDALQAELHQKQIQSLLLVKPSTPQQPNTSDAKRWIQNHYIANSKPNKTLVSKALTHDLSMLEHNRCILDDNHGIICALPIKDRYTKTIATLLTLTPYQAEDSNAVLLRQLGIVFGFLTLTFIVLVILVYGRSHAEKSAKHYFQQILDTTPNIIIVTNGFYAVDGNQSFYDSFNQSVDMLDEQPFNLQHHLLPHRDHPTLMDNDDWLEQIANTPNQIYRVTRTTPQGEITYRIKANHLHHQNDTFYTVVLQDITELQQLHALSVTDALTGIGNRLAFRQSFDSAYQNAKQNHQSLSMIMLDLDHFKAVNDNHGHPVGDKILQQFATLVQSHLEPGMVFCRYGGEEFILLMPNTNVTDAQIFAERIRYNVEHHSNFTDDINLTSSVGLTQLRIANDSPQELFKRLDDALYQSKQNGRNRVTALY